jgi:hypothetical protein
MSTLLSSLACAYPTREYASVNRAFAAVRRGGYPVRVFLSGLCQGLFLPDGRVLQVDCTPPDYQPLESHYYGTETPELERCGPAPV